ncbi:ribonuclease H2 subunit C [Panulirus ornatus]|uniref:ribonuclease H2 subunit C n=1 Tax=Panulirus ornatus TaxID=150431 RepID=UPI003A871E86
MAVNIDLQSGSLKEVDSSHIHYVPCNIKYNGDAAVGKFFTSYIKEETNGEGEKGLTGTYRGYPFIGKEMKVPDGYTGVILKETRPNLNSDEDRTMRGVCQFQAFTFWNWDREPSRGDKYQQAMDWAEIATVIHGSEK